MLRAILDFPGGSVVKNLPTVQEMQETLVQSQVQDDPLEEGMATHSSILAWEIPWTEKPGGLQSMGLRKSQTQLKQLSMHAHYWEKFGNFVNIVFLVRISVLVSQLCPTSLSEFYLFIC